MRASEIEEVLRSDVEEPSPAFAAELDRRVAAGFPKPAPQRRVWLRPALAATAAVVAVGVVAISLLGDDGQHRSTPHVLSAKSSGAPRFDAFSALDATSAARRVQRDVQLTIAAPHDKLQQT